MLDTISETIGTASGITQEDIEKHSKDMSVFHKEVTSQLRQEQYEEDYDYVRDNLKTAIGYGMDMIPAIISLAKDSENARCYEVAAGLLKSLSEINKDLLAVSKVNAPAKQTAIGSELVGIDNSTTHNQTNVFVGTSEDVFAKIFQQRNFEKVIDNNDNEQCPTSSI